MKSPERQPENYMHWQEFNHTILLKKFISVIIGNFLCAIALLLFLKPNEMISGGIGGISILLNTVFHLPVGTLVFLLNVPLMIMGFLYLDRSFMIFSTASIFLFTGYLSLLDFLGQYIHTTDDVLLACIFGALINGLGMGIMFRSGTCQGGLDILAALFRKKWGINIGKVLMAVNGVIITISAFIYSVDRALYTLVALFIAYQVLDKIQMGVGKQKQVFIISERDEEITKMIHRQMNRGVTYLKGMGAYTGTPHKVIFCIVSTPQLVQLRQLVTTMDPEAFIAVTETVEVKGRGFKRMEI
ncbi:MAG: YitT family protein [Tissierellia bacterium]|nr:YitT family protein [Tissierellia bacterium]